MRNVTKPSTQIGCSVCLCRAQDGPCLCQCSYEYQSVFMSVCISTCAQEWTAFKKWKQWLGVFNTEMESIIRSAEVIIDGSLTKLRLQVTQLTSDLVSPMKNGAVPGSNAKRTYYNKSLNVKRLCTSQIITPQRGLHLIQSLCMCVANFYVNGAWSQTAEDVWTRLANSENHNLRAERAGEKPRGDTANDKSTSKSALVCAFMGHPHAACLWLKPAVPLSMSSPLSSDRSSKGESLEILTAWTHTGPKRKILKQGTPRNKYLCLKYLDYIPRNPQPLCSYSNSAGCASIMHPDLTRWMHFKGDASFGSRGYRPQSSWGVLGQRG